MSEEKLQPRMARFHYGQSWATRGLGYIHVVASSGGKRHHWTYLVCVWSLTTWWCIQWSLRSRTTNQSMSFGPQAIVLSLELKICPMCYLQDYWQARGSVRYSLCSLFLYRRVQVSFVSPETTWNAIRHSNPGQFSGINAFFRKQLVQ